MTTQFPQLQGEATSGKIKVWSIRVFEQADDDKVYGVIETSHGYEGGKMQVAQKVIMVGKNIGKKNETTPLQQAIQEAKSAWTKKTESGYKHGDYKHGDYKHSDHIQLDSLVEAVDDEEKKEDVNMIVSGPKGKGFDDSVPAPMLAHDYSKRGKSIIYPCYAQKKYDGVRCVAIPGQGLFSRLKKKFPHLSHITEEINKLHPNFILDGELYSDTLTFQEIVGIVKRETLKKGDQEKQSQIKFHVYDIINSQEYSIRYINLQHLFKRNNFKHLILVHSDVCASEEKMKELHGQYVADGFEGLMLRNKTGKYVNNRSVDLQKYKEFFDMECEIVDYKQGEGLEEGCVVWVAKTAEGKQFACRPRGTREERQEQFQNGETYKGKMLTVRYQEKTDDGLLRFPVGISIRDYE